MIYETIGIYDHPSENDDDRAVLNFCDTVEYKDGRYLVTWPRKLQPTELARNYALCIGRLKSLRKRFFGTQVWEDYNKNFEDQLRAGIIEKVRGEQVKRYYIPHQAVLTPNKATTKLRVVFDASAKCSKSQQSLNEALLRGPVLLPDICGILIRCRLRPWLLMADAEKAFLQVGLKEADREVTNFIWLKDYQSDVTEQYRNVSFYPNNFWCYK